MSEQDDLAAIDGGDGLAPEDADSWVDDPADDGWSPVMGTPPPDAEPGIDGDADSDWVPPHEQADTGLAPPLPEGDGVGELGDAPPPPPTDTELPPALPEDLVDLSDGGDGVGEAPMPPVTGDTATAPPAAGEVDLSGDGPPVAPGAPDGSTQSPVPDMGSSGDAATPGTTGEIDLSTGDGAPMPPVTGDTTTAPPGGADDVDLGNGDAPVAPTVPNPGVGEDQSPVPSMGDELPEPGTTEPGTIVDDDIIDEPEDSTLVVVEPGQERITAAALTGAFLDEMDMDDPARERMIDLLTEAAADGEITEEELFAAFEQAGFEDTPTEGTGTTITTIINEAPRSAVVRIEGEGLGPFRVSANGDSIELESLRSGSVYSARPQDVEQAWRDSGSRLITAPPVEPIAAVEAPKATPEPEDGSNDTRRNLLIAGAVLLPLAGGATYLATRKIR